MNKAVINITANSQRLIERSLLCMIGENPVFYTNLIHAYIISQYNVKINYRDINTTKGVCRLRKDDELSIPVAKARGIPLILVISLVPDRKCIKEYAQALPSGEPGGAGRTDQQQKRRNLACLLSLAHAQPGHLRNNRWAAPDQMPGGPDLLVI